MVWIYLLLAGLLEIVWAWAAGQSDGFTVLAPTLLVVAVMPASFWLLARAIERLPAGTTYAIWTAFGAIGTAILGIVALGEDAGPLRLLGLAVVIVGVVLLRLAEGGRATPADASHPSARRARRPRPGPTSPARS